MHNPGPISITPLNTKFEVNLMNVFCTVQGTTGQDIDGQRFFTFIKGW